MGSIATSQRKSVGSVSDEHLQRLSAIPLLFGDGSRRSTTTAHIAEDSWKAGNQIGRRDLLDGHLRRTAFVAGQYRFELVAERRAGRWEFVGRVYYRGRTQYDLVLAVGRKRLAPDSGGFFHWTSAHSARRLMLLSDKKRFALESITW